MRRLAQGKVRQRREDYERNRKFDERERGASAEYVICDFQLFF